MNSGTSPFGRAAELYEEVRPSYPRALVAAVVKFAGLSSDTTVIEVGCGTGKATRLFAPLCREIVCIDPDPAMLKVARHALRRRTNVKYVEATFEGFQLEPGGFDLLISAQAFHWVNPDVGYEKAGRALKPAGVIALFWHVDDPLEDELRRAMDLAYREHAPDLAYRAPGGQPGTSDVAALLRGTRMFGPVSTYAYPWTGSYDAKEWVKMLSTFSDHIRVPERRRVRLFSALRDVIDAHGGTYRTRTTTTLFLAKRL